MEEIKIGMAKKIAETLDYDGIIMYGFKSGVGQHITTYGKTIKGSKCMAKIGNHMKKELEWPDESCHAEPIKRICENCSFYKSQRDFFNDYRLEGGLCFYEPKRLEREPKSIACHNFEGNTW